MVESSSDMSSQRKKHSWLSPIVVACCKSNDGTTKKARRYRFLKQSEERKLTLYLELKKIQVDEGRNYYPTSFKFASLALLS
jgi:hypothetical protein